MAPSGCFPGTKICCMHQRKNAIVINIEIEFISKAAYKVGKGVYANTSFKSGSNNIKRQGALPDGL